MFNKILYKSKDLALSTVIKTIINKKLKRFGSVSTLKFNTKDKKIELKLGLKGELEPLHIVLNRYELREEEDKNYLIFSDIETSREWINLVAEEYLHYEKFEIPTQYVKMLKRVM